MVMPEPTASSETAATTSSAPGQETTQHSAVHGNDLFVAEVGDGNDVYFGDDSNGGAGVDTLDMSAATANVTVHLGSGALFDGTASSSQTGNDTIWGDRERQYRFRQ